MAADEMSAIALVAVSSSDGSGTLAEIVAAGAIPPLVALLGTVGVQEKAAGALWNLANDDDTRAVIASSGAVPPPGGDVGHSVHGSCEG